MTVLSERGVPTPVVHTRLRAPRASMTPARDVDGAAKASPLWTRYGTRVDRESAAELLAARVERTAEADAPGPTRKRRAEQAAKDPLTDLLGSRQGKRLQREIVRGVFGMLRKRL